MDSTRRPLLSVSEVSDFVGIPESTIFSQRHKGVGIGALGIRIGRHLRWRPEDIDRWLDEQLKASATRSEERRT